MTTITLRDDLAELAKAIAPVYCKYDRQAEPQPAFIELNIESGAVNTGYSGEIGNAVPASVWHGIDRRYRIAPAITGKALAEFLAAAEFQALAQRIVAGSEVVWDGNNHVSRLDDDAKAAEEALESLVERELFQTDELALVWDAEALFAACSLFDHWPKDKALADAVKEIEEAAKSENAHLDVDLDDALLAEAESYLNHRPGELGEVHIATLVNRCRMTEEDAAEWREEHGEA